MVIIGIDAHTQTVAGVIENAEDYAETPPQIKPLKNEFDRLYSAYVMDHQRDLHSHVLGGRKPQRRQPGTPQAAVASNVELF